MMQCMMIVGWIVCGLIAAATRIVWSILDYDELIIGDVALAVVLLALGPLGVVLMLGLLLLHFGNRVIWRKKP